MIEGLTRGWQWKPALFLLTCFGAQPVAAADWQPVEQVKSYAVEGRTGAELYASIGARGPDIGQGMRTIATTSFKLTWTRKYDAKDGTCRITVAIPKLVITYVLPKLASKPPPGVNASWQRFIRGVEAHEKVHGGYIKELVRQIEAVSLGMTVPNDPQCAKFRVQLTERLGELSRAERQKNVDFDRVEMSDGGNVHQLILALVNGP